MGWNERKVEEEKKEEYEARRKVKRNGKKRCKGVRGRRWMK